MRMQFWKAAIEDIYRDEAPLQPVSAELWKVGITADLFYETGLLLAFYV